MSQSGKKKLLKKNLYIRLLKMQVGAFHIAIVSIESACNYNYTRKLILAIGRHL